MPRRSSSAGSSPSSSPESRGKYDRRDYERDRGRDRKREGSRGRDNDRKRDNSRDRDRKRESSRDRDRKRENSRDRDRKRESSRDRDRKRESSRDRDRKRESSRDRDRKRDSSNERDVRKGISSRDEYGRVPHALSPEGRSPDPIEVERRRAEKEERRREKEERMRQKELLKAAETPEEKRARRLAKKAAKEEKKRMAMGWDKDHLAYSNTDNPFGDQHLLDKFAWHKKKQKEAAVTGLSEDELERRERQRQEENKIELQRLKERRAQREKELEEQEKLRELEARQRASENIENWAEKEEKFHIEQAKMRSRLRIESGRAKPIDVLVKYITTDIDSSDVDIHEPHAVFTGLNMDDLEDLQADIEVYLRIGEDADYWRDLLTICEAEIEQKNHARYDTGISDAVREQIDKMFSNKTSGELEALEAQINAKLSSGERIDVGYWESLLQQLVIFQAKARLLELHKAVLRSKLNVLAKEGLLPAADKPDGAEEAEPSRRGEDVVISESDIITDGEAEPELTIDIGEEYDGVYSPPLTDTEEGPVITEVEYQAMLTSERQRVFYEKEAQIPQRVISMAPNDTSVDASVARERARGMEQGEAEFGVQVALSDQTYGWEDKYRPRKPRFFNRVHTGFEWNKYNQTHYDKENPPPKMVQGYKFNLFYPDLIEKHVAPTYTLVPIPDEPDFCVLRFSAGPPYEDIAFKIVKRDWEYGHKHGFKCSFDRGVFSLWFHFKRQRYRR